MLIFTSSHGPSSLINIRKGKRGCITTRDPLGELLKLLDTKGLPPQGWSQMDQLDYITTNMCISVCQLTTHGTRHQSQDNAEPRGSERYLSLNLSFFLFFSFLSIFFYSLFFSSHYLNLPSSKLSLSQPTSFLNFTFWILPIPLGGSE